MNKLNQNPPHEDPKTKGHQESDENKDRSKCLYCSYENYSEASKYYDSYRRPVAVEEIVTNIQQHAANFKVAPEDLVIADLGCGTGNYITELTNRIHFKRFIGVEYNEGMLGRAKSKLEGKKGVEFIQASILDLPLKKEEVDVVIINQVLHHLDSEPAVDSNGEPDFPNLRLALQEIRKILKASGLLLINFLDPIQLKGFWQISHLMVTAKLGKMMSRFADHEFYKRELKNAGFDIKSMHKVSEFLMDDKYYLDTKLVLDPNFRKANSFWALLSPKETEDALKRFHKIISFFGEAPFQEIIKKEAEFYGQSTEVISTKLP